MKAYFRNIPFDIESHEESIGYYTKVFEPLSGTPWVEIFGKKPKEFPVQGFFVGFDAKLRCDLFMASCQSPTPGTLLHPSLGMLEVYCSELTLSETSDKKNLISFKAVFWEAPKSKPNILKEASNFLAEKKAFLLLQVNNFIQVFSGVNESYFLMSQAKDLISTFNQSLVSEAGLGLLSNLQRNGDEAIQDVQNEILNLLKSPDNLTRILVEELLSLTRDQSLNLVTKLLEKPTQQKIESALNGLVFAALLGNLTSKDVVLLAKKYFGNFKGETLNAVNRLRILALKEQEKIEPKKKMLATNAILTAFHHYSDPEMASQIAQKTGQVFLVTELNI